MSVVSGTPNIKGRCQVCPDRRSPHPEPGKFGRPGNPPLLQKKPTNIWANRSYLLLGLANLQPRQELVQEELWSDTSGDTPPDHSASACLRSNASPGCLLTRPGQKEKILRRRCRLQQTHEWWLVFVLLTNQFTHPKKKWKVRYAFTAKKLKLCVSCSAN